MKKIILSLFILFLSACSETKKEKTENYDIGFFTIQTVDRTRIYKPNSDKTDNLHYRPLDIDIWYPAKSSGKDSVLRFQDILGLLEARAKYYTASNEWNGITPKIAQSLCEGFNCSDSTNLLNFRTRTYRKAEAVDAKFPLVIYLCAFNGMSYENFSLFEELAKRGFVVISINSIGRYPGDMTMKKEDLFEQVNDAIASLKAVNQSLNIDFSKIGIIGYSWGGLSGALLASGIPDVPCLISLEGSEFHHYGENEEEDSDFNEIRNSSDFFNMRITAPYLRLESSQMDKTAKIDSVYNFSEKLIGDKLILKIDSAKHEDFSCLSAVVRESGHCKAGPYFGTVLKLTLSFLQDHLKNMKSFSNVLEQKLGKTVSNK